jgi:chromosome segregation ATPase
MASYAELLQTCAEFQENFAALTGKYNALALEMKNTKAVCERRQQQLAEAATREEKQHQQLIQLKRELEEASGFRDKYCAASVTIEHLKVQVTNARQSATDAFLEHNQEVEQLKQQLDDMVKRVETAADGQRLRESQKQVLELEERCAAVNAQLLEERERHSQQLLTAHNALREQQSRNLELEQRYRAAEAETTEMRTAVRRSAELQSEAALLKERYATAASLAQHQVEELRTEVEDTRRRLAQMKLDHQAQLDQKEQEMVEERHTLNERITALEGDLVAAQRSLADERGRVRQLQITSEQQVQRARDANLTEMSALRRAQTILKEENTRLHWRVEKGNNDVREKEQALQAAQERYDSIQSRMKELQRQLDVAAQQEAWLTAEKSSVTDQLTASRQQIDELTKALVHHDEVILQVQQLKVQLDNATEEAVRSRQAALQSESQLHDIEEAAARQVRALRKELKAYKKQCTSEAARADSLRRKLMAALVEKEAELYQISRVPPSGRCAALPATTEAPAMAPAPNSGLSYGGGYDVIGMLRSQTEQAEALHSRLVQLAR